MPRVSSSYDRDRDTALSASPVQNTADRNNRDYLRWAQHSLNRMLGLRLPVDGVRSQLTRSAIRSFQQKHGLPVDGVVGPETARALIAAGAGNPPRTASWGQSPPIGSSPRPRGLKQTEIYTSGEIQTWMESGEELEALTAAALGVAVFSEGRQFLTSGSLSFASRTVNYMHENTPRTQQFMRTTVELKISAHHPRLGFGNQEFWFRLSFEHNGNDLRNVQISLLEDKSSRMISSEFSIQFDGQPHSPEREPVAEVNFQINGKWDPVGLGVASFWGNLFVKADGGARMSIGSEQNWVWFDGASNLQRQTLGPAPTPTPSTPSSGPLTPRATVKKGSRGPSVSDLQTRLNRWLQSQNQAPLLVDGIFGDRTLEAVKAFQRSRSITVDGIVGPQTWAHVLAL